MLTEVLDNNGWYLCGAVGHSKLMQQYYLAGGNRASPSAKPSKILRPGFFPDRNS
jgi:hypothetical protein